MAQKLQKLNMGNILKRVGYVTGQSRKITYYRPPIYGRDDYGVETGAVDTEEILIPNVQAYMRNIVEKDYVIQRAGHNIVGKARVYLPNLTTLKNFPNFNQNNNLLFNEVEGFDKLLDLDRVVYTVPTSGTGDWTTTAGTLSSDGESLTVTLDTTANGTLTYAVAATNTLEANRLTFKLRAKGSAGEVQFNSSHSWQGGTTAAYQLDYDNSDIKLIDDEWLTVDLPFTSGTVTHPASSSSIYLSGTRYNVAITSGSTFDYKSDFRQFQVAFSGGPGYEGDTLDIREIKFYKAIEWSVHSINDYNDEFMVLDCVRTAGKRESRRRAY